VSGAPVESTRPNRTTEGSFTAPTALWLQAGAATVLDGSNVFRRDGANFTALTIGTATDPRTPGAIRALTTRNDGVFLAGTDGTTVAGGRVREYRFDATPVAHGGVAQNGGYFVAINYARMARLRPVTAYQGARDWIDVVAAPADDGIARTVLAPHR